MMDIAIQIHRMYLGQKVNDLVAGRARKSLQPLEVHQEGFVGVYEMIQNEMSRLAIEKRKRLRLILNISARVLAITMLLLWIAMLGFLSPLSQVTPLLIPFILFFGLLSAADACMDIGISKRIIFFFMKKCVDI
jgi:hypothetical protein